MEHFDKRTPIPDSARRATTVLEALLIRALAIWTMLAQLCMGLNCIGLGAGFFESTERFHSGPDSNPITSSELRDREGAPDAIVKTSSETEEWYYYYYKPLGFDELRTPIGYRWWGPYLHAGCIGIPLVVPIGRDYRKYVIRKQQTEASYSTDTNLCFAGCMCTFVPHNDKCECSFGCDSHFANMLR